MAGWGRSRFAVSALAALRWGGLGADAGADCATRTVAARPRAHLHLHVSVVEAMRGLLLDLANVGISAQWPYDPADPQVIAQRGECGKAAARAGAQWMETNIGSARGEGGGGGAGIGCSRHDPG